MSSNVKEKNIKGNSLRREILWEFCSVNHLLDLMLATLALFFSAREIPAGFK